MRDSNQPDWRSKPAIRRGIADSFPPGALARRARLRLNARMDWKIIIQELQAAGLTQQEIAKECMTGQSHISSLARGKRLEPRHSLGERLLRLHRDRTHIRRAEAA